MKESSTRFPQPLKSLGQILETCAHEVFCSKFCVYSYTTKEKILHPLYPPIPTMFLSDPRIFNMRLINLDFCISMKESRKSWFS